MKNKLYGALLVLLLAAFGAAGASAQVDVSPGVARISLVRGEVSTQRGDSGDWAAAALNQPVVTGDRVSTGADSRAELQLDYANILRLADNSQATIANLSNNQMQVQIGQGLADYTVLKGSEISVEIDTPNVAIHPDKREGVYRVEISADGETRVIVRKGSADISTPQGSTRLEGGQSATIRGTGDQTAYKVEDAPDKDAWDSWNNDRDNTIYKAQSWNHTNRYYTGSEDLDAYGRWVNVPDYGQVWQPVVSTDWVPYRDGRWVYEPYYGWTWVSYEPWGWAPYHYGRWFVYGSSWVWWPGPVYRPYRPIWAPAYVSFFGFGNNWGVSVGFGWGSVGWLPCGPGDGFYPWYGRYRSRFNVVNVTNVTNIYNYRNRTTGGFPPLRSSTGYSNLRMINRDPVRRALSTVPADRFGGGRISATPASHEMLRNGRLVDGNLPIVPTRASLSASDRAANPSTVRGGQSRFFEKARPAVAEPFDRQATQLQQAIQRDRKFTPIRASGGNEGQKPSPAISSRASLENPRGPAQQAGAVTHMPSRIGTAEVNRGTSGNPARPGNNPGAAGNPKPEISRGAVTGENPGRAVNTPQPERGWQRFGSPVAQNNPPEPPQRSVPKPSNAGPNVTRPNNDGPNIAKPAQDQSGWRRFGDNGQNAGRNTSPSQPQPNRGASQKVPRPEARIPSANAPAGNNSPNRSDGWRNFGGNGPSGGRNTPSAPPQPNRGGSQNVPRPQAGMPSGSSPAQGASPNRSDGWRQFTPESRQAAPENRGGFSQGNRFPSNDSRGIGSSRPNGGYTQNSRPPLNLGRPILTPRPSGNMGGSREMPSYNRGGGGGSRSMPSGGAPHGAPSGGAPRGNPGGSAPHGGGGGQPHSGGRR